MPTSRRSFLQQGVALVFCGTGCASLRHSAAREVNDVQSRLNKTVVEHIVKPDSLSQVERVISNAAAQGKAVSVCGGRHAMGGQQFISQGFLLDTTDLTRVLKFDSQAGIIEVEAGMQWPQLYKVLQARQRDPDNSWTLPRNKLAPIVSASGVLSVQTFTAAA